MTAQPTGGTWCLPMKNTAASTLWQAERLSCPTLADTCLISPRRPHEWPSFMEFLEAPSCGGAIICTDGSGECLPIKEWAPHTVEVQIVGGPHGAAAGRNAGLGIASVRGFKWAWLIDSDCAPRRQKDVHGNSTLEALISAWKPGCAAVQGKIMTRDADSLANKMNLFRPPFDSCGPQTVVTANVLIHIPTAISINGFDESFPGAAAEDTDFGYRLRQCGHSISMAEDSVVLHDDFDIDSMLPRLRGYGAGMRRFARKHGIEAALVPDCGSHPWMSLPHGFELVASYLQGWNDAA